MYYTSSHEMVAHQCGGCSGAGSLNDSWADTGSQNLSNNERGMKPREKPVNVEDFRVIYYWVDSINYNRVPHGGNVPARKTERRRALGEQRCSKVQAAACRACRGFSWCRTKTGKGVWGRNVIGA